jgi:hypothetical protein
MNDLSIFKELPKLEWYNDTPFVFAKLVPDYAALLAQKALEFEPEIVNFEARPLGPLQIFTNPTGARYPYYNSFLLDGDYIHLYLAARHCFKFLLNALKHENYPSFIHSWYNISQIGHRIERHTHQAQYIGSFLAFAEGSTTSYGPLKYASEKDHVFENHNGMLILTKSDMSNFHEVSEWTNPDHPRISYAFDIIDHNKFNPKSTYIPFDGF